MQRRPARTRLRASGVRPGEASNCRGCADSWVPPLASARATRVKLAPTTKRLHVELLRRSAAFVTSRLQDFTPVRLARCHFRLHAISFTSGCRCSPRPPAVHLALEPAPPCPLPSTYTPARNPSSQPQHLRPSALGRLPAASNYLILHHARLASGVSLSPDPRQWCRHPSSSHLQFSA